MFKTAVIQIDSQQNSTDNLETVLTCIQKAADNYAQLIALPENFLYIGPDKSYGFSIESVEIQAIKDIAKEYSVYILAGTIQEKTATAEKFFNTSLMINPDGQIIATYRKIHLFDVSLGASPEFSESSYTCAGDKIITAHTELGIVGMSICYDLRFPELYRHLRYMNSDIFTIPSNFTLFTGKDHWLPLLRARAIENGVYVLAPNQCGVKHDGNYSYGRSVIIDPWGIPIAQASDTSPSIIYADIDPEFTKTIRKTIPSFQQIRLFNPDPQDGEIDP